MPLRRTSAALLASAFLAASSAAAAAPAPSAPPLAVAEACPGRLLVGPIGSAADDRARVAELTGAAPVRPQLFRRWSSVTETPLCSAPAPRLDAFPDPLPPRDVELEALPLTWRTYLESGYPDDRNDGALFRGRGVSTEATGGVRLRWRFFSAAVAPVVAWQQNREFFRPVLGLPGYSPFANPFNGGQIDLPLRHGPTDFWTVDPGQSYARVDLFNVALGISTENLWWGPGIRNSILMSNSAPGMPHVFLGTSRPVDVWIGWLEAQLLWGRPLESRWFDADAGNDRRLFTALTMGYEPRWVRGLFLGFARVFVDAIPPEGLSFLDYFGRQFHSLSPQYNGRENQLISLFARWVFPESGLELYGEWARDDYAANIRDLLTQPEHDAAFLLGLQKVFATRAGWLRLHAELTHTLDRPVANPIPGRGNPIFYTHGAELQGYTHGGQMLGAGVGPQADTQFLALDLFHDRGRAGLWFERVLRNGSFFWTNVHAQEGQDVEIVAGLRGGWSWRDLDLDASLAVGHRYDLNFGPDADSLKAMLAVSWWPGRRTVPALPRSR